MRTISSAALLFLIGCNGQVASVLVPDPAPPAGLTGDDAPATQQTSGRVDLLFAVDNSSSMRPKQVVLAQSAGRLVDRLVKPLCRDANGAAQSQSVLDARGDATCPSGTSLEFAAVKDLHVGIVTSSLGNAGNDGSDAVCTDMGGRIVSDHAQLTARGLPSGAKIEAAKFLAYGATAGQNAYDDVTALEASLEQMILGVGDTGCGLEDQLESVYQFLIAPDPWDQITNDGAQAVYTGINGKALQQRHDFLRPDSLVSVVLVTDEDDASLDPLSVGGTGHYFKAQNFPQSDGASSVRIDQTSTAARGTSACDTDPNSASCTSCAFAQSDPSVAADPNCRTSPYYGGDDDDLNVRFFDLKKRFGIDPLYPTARYVRGFSQLEVPARDDEHIAVVLPAQSTSYDVTAASCRNPLFAASLPGGPTPGELCDLPAGPRNASLVFFTVLGGVPNDLVAEDKLDADGRLRDDAWKAILGTDYEKYARDGLDPRLVQSITPRAGRPDPSAVDAEPNDPDNHTHRDWDTKKRDLQYACSFPLPAAVQIPASAAGDCARDSDAPLCETRNQGQDRAQIRARAYPTPRPFTVAKALGRQSTIASLCPRDDTSDTTSASFGYRPALDALLDRMAAGLAK